MAIEGGLFLTMIGVSVIFLVANIRYKEYFYFVPVFLFLVLGLWLLGNETVTFETQTTDGTTWINQTSYLIGNNSGEYNIYTGWLGLAFIIGSIILAFVAFLGLTDRKEGLQR